MGRDANIERYIERLSTSACFFIIFSHLPALTVFGRSLFSNPKRTRPSTVNCYFTMFTTHTFLGNRPQYAMTTLGPTASLPPPAHARRQLEA